MLIASTVTNELVALDTKTGERKRTIRDIVDPYQLGFSPDGKWFVTAAYRLDHVDIYRYDGDFKLAGRIFIDGMPSHLDFDNDSKTVFVSLQQSTPRRRLRSRDAEHQVERRGRQGAGRRGHAARQQAPAGGADRRGFGRHPRSRGTARSPAG